MLLLVDNFDSFTHLLASYFKSLGQNTKVVSHSFFSEDLLKQASFLVLGPGPGDVEASGASLDYIKAALGRIPLLGVCLGHQCLAVACGGKVKKPVPVSMVKPVGYSVAPLFFFKVLTNYNR